MKRLMDYLFLRLFAMNRDSGFSDSDEKAFESSVMQLVVLLGLPIETIALSIAASIFGRSFLTAKALQILGTAIAVIWLFLGSSTLRRVFRHLTDATGDISRFRLPKERYLTLAGYVTYLLFFIVFMLAMARAVSALITK